MKKTMTRALSLLLACMLALGMSMAVSAADTETTVVAGDVNGDGVCTIFDVLLILRAMLSDKELAGGDINGDGKLSLVDVIRALKLSASADAPEAGESEEGTADITVENGTTKDAVSLNGESVSAAVPAGVAVKDGATSLTLTVSAMADTNGNITPGETEEAISYDVHIEGVSEDNTVPIIVDLGAILPVGQNTGTVMLYHVENGVTNTMTQVMSLAELDTHNEFYYYPATGNVYVALATFSEIALVNDTANQWDGTADHEWYDASKKELVIANANQLHSFAQIVGGMADGIARDTFNGKTVKLAADVDFGDAEATNRTGIIFYPIGYYFTTDKNGDGTEDDVYSTVYAFEGTFDGTGHTIANFYHNTWEMTGDYNNGYPAGSNHYNDAMGLFGYVVGGDPEEEGHTVATVKNLTIKNFSSDGEFAPTGVITAYAKGAVVFENISLFDCNPRTYNTGVAGIVGWDDGGDADTAEERTHYTFRNITIDNSNTVSALWGSWDVGAAGILGYLGPKSTAEFIDCNVAAKLDVNNDVCANYQYYWYRYCGMLIGTVDRTDSTGAALDLSGITATNCSVNFGDWNDYYYCELVHNSRASYTHDHQFSKLVEVSSEAEMTTTGTHHYVIVDRTVSPKQATCYHYINGALHTHGTAGTEIVDGVEVDIEDKTLVNLPFNQIFGGYGWGVKGTQITDDFDISVLGVTEGTVTSSSEKFAGTGVASVPTGAEVSVGDLFTKTDIGNPIMIANVQVAVSAVNGSGVTAVYTANTTDWTKGTLVFSGVGTATVTIQDYNFCLPTTITVTVEEPASVDKFAATDVVVEHSVENGSIAKTLGEIFAATGNGEINSANVTVDIDDTALCTYEKNTSDWTQSALTFTGTGTVTLSITDNNLCNTATATVTITEPDETEKFAVVFPNVAKYLYRVGNKNTVALGSLFKAEDGIAERKVTITVEKLDENCNAAATYTASDANWTAGTIKFTGTGPVVVTIDDNRYTTPLTLNLEVVDAYNVTTYSGGSYPLSNRNSVLLDNITMSSGGTFYLRSATLYGNGFTFDCKNAATAGTGTVSGNYVIGLENAHLDNVEIIGAVYSEYGAVAADNYNRALVVCKGTNTITNCYLSNTASPIRLVEGNLAVKGSTVKGGNFANIDVRNGTLVLEDITTINQALGNDPAANGTDVIGLGIVVYYENVDAALTSVVIKGDLMQYNHISENDTFSNEYAKELVAEMLANESYAETIGTGTKWVNAGIVSMSAGITIAVDDASNAPSGYFGQSVSFYGQDGYVYSKKPTAESVAAEPETYSTLGQGAIAPSYSFDYTTKNYIEKTGDSNDYCYYDYDAGKVLMAMDEGDTFNWDPFILTATKYGKTLDYTVSMNGTTYSSGEKIPFNTTGNYTVVYTYNDNDNYVVEAGEVSTTAVTYTKTVSISVSVIPPSAKPATFTFVRDNTATEKITVNNNTYVSAKGVSATDKAWGYITVNGTKIFYPITEAQMKTSSKLFGGKETQAYYYVFKDTVIIEDNGTSYGESTTNLADGKLTVVNGMEAKYASISSACVDAGSLNKDGPSGEVWDFSASTTESQPEQYNNYLAFKSPSGLAVSDSTRNYDAITVAQFCYTDATGTPNYYFIGYFMPNQNTSSSSGSGCFAEGTMITLADGTQKPIEEITYADELLAWDLNTGAYATTTPSLIESHESGEYRVINLLFSDDAEVRIIVDHGFFDVAENNFVFLNEENVASYLGHEFVKVGENGTYTTATLVDYTVTVETVSYYTIQTAVYNNCIAENMFTLTSPPEGVDGWFDYFEIGEGMKYDEEKMQADIDKYGLYEYEDFAEYVTYEQFIAFNGPYLKVLVGRGVVTYEQILELIATYVNPNA